MQSEYSSSRPLIDHVPVAPVTQIAAWYWYGSVPGRAPATSADSSNNLGIGISLRIFDRKTGEQKLDTGLLKVTLPAATGSLAVPTAKRIPIDSLAPGVYRLELEATDTGGQSARRTADFDIQ
jgi:hypothetical protein